MILYRRGFGLFDQEQLAKFFDVRVNAESQKMFNVKLKRYTRANLDEGIKTVESAALVNRFFRVRKIPLIARAVRASEIKDLKAFIADELSQDHDLWVEYKSHQIHKSESIHDNVLERLTADKKGARVVLVDPYPKNKTRATVSISKLKTALSAKFGRETGFLVIAAT